MQIGYPRRFDPAFAAARARRGNRRTRLGAHRPVHHPGPGTARHAATSRSPAGSSATAACTTSTPSAGSPAGRSSRSTPPAAPAAPTSSPSSATSPPRRLCSPSTTAPPRWCPTPATTPRGHDVRLELHGTDDSVAAGWSDTTPLRNLEPGATWPAGTTGHVLHGPARPRPSAPSSTHSPKSLPGNGHHRAPSTMPWPWPRSPRPPPCPCNSTARCRSTRSDSMTDPPAQARDTRPNRIAGAPISWGVCEVPNWGYQLTPERVLAEMQDIGLSATELGPDGFLPADPRPDGQGARRPPADRGRWLHPGAHAPARSRPAPRDRPHPRAVTTPPAPKSLVLSAVSGLDGYDSRPELDADGWALLLRNLDRISARAAEHGVRRRAAPARRHHGRDRRRGPAGARGLRHLAVPGHRAPADRRHRPGRTHPAGPRTASPTPTSRTSTTPSRPRSAPAH